MTAGVCLLFGFLVAAPAGEPPRSLDPRLTVQRFAAEPEIVTPVGIAVDRAGRVLVVESHTHFRPANYAGPPADRIRVLEDRNNDGRSERVSTFYEGSKHTMGLAFHPANGALLYVVTRNEVFLLRDADGDARADGPPETLVRLDTLGDYPHNGLSGFAFDAAGRVYFGLGENLGAAYKLIGRDGTTLTGGGEGGNIYRCQPDGTRLERVATGFWNPFGLAFDVYSRLFAVDNDPDSRPPCRLLQVVPGGDYGFRFRYGRKGLHPFTAWNGELPGTLPMLAGTGEAPAGVVVYESNGLPLDYRGDILLTSWGDHRLERSRPVSPHTTASVGVTLEPFITGGEDFRPVGLAVAPDGALFVSDWVDRSYALHGKGRVWRISAREQPGRTIPIDDEEALAHPHRPAREATARRLAAAGPAGRTVLRRAAMIHPDERARAVAFDTLVNTIEPGDDTAFHDVLHDQADAMRALAVRRLPARLVDFAAVAAVDPASEVRAEALRRIIRPEAAGVLLKALDDPDPFLRQAAREGMKNALGVDALRGIAASASDTDPARRLGALLVLRDLDTAEARLAVPTGLRDPDPTVRFAALQWVADAALAKYRPLIVEGLTAANVTQPLFEATMAALERLDGGNLKPNEERAGEGYLVALLADPNSRLPAAVIRRVLRMLRPDHPALSESRLATLLQASDPLLRLEAVRTLCDGPLPGRFDRLAAVAADPAQPEAVRAEAVASLAGGAADPARRQMLVDLAAGRDPILRHEALRSLRGVPLDASARSRLAAANSADPQTVALIALLSGAKPGGAKTIPETLSDWLERLRGPADPAAGERVFFHARGPGCFHCHKVDGRGGRVGPDLSTTGATLTRDRLIESIIDPSKEIAPQYVSWAVALHDGRVFNGIRMGEAGGGEVYGDNQGQLIPVKASDVEEAKPLKESIMPADLPRLMTTQEFRDLVAYLRDRRP